MARYRSLQQKDNFGAPIDTGVPYKPIDEPFRDEVNIVQSHKSSYRPSEIHPVDFQNLRDWDTGETPTLETLDYPRERKSVTHATLPKEKKEKQTETIVSIVVDGEEEDFYVSKDSNTAYLVKCETLKIESVVETKVTNKWTVKGKGAKSYRDNIVEAVKEFKK